MPDTHARGRFRATSVSVIINEIALYLVPLKSRIKGFYQYGHGGALFCAIMGVAPLIWCRIVPWRALF